MNLPLCVCVPYIGSASFCIFYTQRERELQYPHSAGCQSGNNNNTSECWTNLNGCEPRANSSMFIGGHLMHYTRECVVGHMAVYATVCMCVCVKVSLHCCTQLYPPALQQTVCVRVAASTAASAFTVQSLHSVPPFLSAPPPSLSTVHCVSAY